MLAVEPAAVSEPSGAAIPPSIPSPKAEWVPVRSYPNFGGQGGGTATAFSFKATGFPSTTHPGGVFAGMIIQRIETKVQWISCDGSASHNSTVTHYEAILVAETEPGVFEPAAGLLDLFADPGGLCDSEFFIEMRGFGKFIPYNDDTAGWLLDMYRKEFPNKPKLADPNGTTDGPRTNPVRNPQGGLVTQPLPPPPNQEAAYSDSHAYPNSTQEPKGPGGLDANGQPITERNWDNDYGLTAYPITGPGGQGDSKFHQVFGVCCPSDSAPPGQEMRNN